MFPIHPIPRFRKTSSRKQIKKNHEWEAHPTLALNTNESLHEIGQQMMKNKSFSFLQKSFSFLSCELLMEKAVKPIRIHANILAQSLTRLHDIY